MLQAKETISRFQHHFPSLCEHLKATVIGLGWLAFAGFILILILALPQLIWIFGVLGIAWALGQAYMHW